MTIHEPATLLTDCLLALLAGGLAWRLPRHNPAMFWWRRALHLTAASALVGGAYHGFAPHFPADVALFWWTVTLWIICVLSAAMAMSLVHELAPRAHQRRWTGAIFLLLVASGVVAIFHPVFLVAIAAYGLAMLAWTVAALVLRRAWSAAMLLALALSGAAALVQQGHWAPLPQFNHNDLYHVIQAFALVAFYRAGLKLGRVSVPAAAAGP